MDPHWPSNCTAQCSILPIGSVSVSRSSVRHFPEQSWTVVAFPCFTVVKSFTSWYGLLLLFILRFSSFSLHCSPVQFSLAFFMHLLNCCSLPCISQILQVQIVSFSGPSFGRTDQKILQQPRVLLFLFCFLLTMCATDLTGCFNYCCVEGGDH